MQPEIVKQAKTATTQAVATKPQGGALTSELKGAWGSEGVDASDMLIPRILLMQGLSKLVSAGERNLGDIIRSTNKEVLATKTGAVEFIPIKTFKTYVLFDCSGRKPEFRSIEPVTAGNADAPLEYMVDGKPWRRDRCLNFYVILPQDIIKEEKAREAIKRGEYPDTDDVLLPAVLSFSRSGYQAGRELATHFKKAESFGIPPASRAFKLGTRLMTNDQGTWPAFTVEKSRAVTEPELRAAERWYGILSNAAVRVDDLEEEGHAGAAAPPPGDEDLSKGIF